MLPVSVATPLPEKAEADGDGVDPSLGEGACVVVPEAPTLLLPASGDPVPAPLLLPQRLALPNGDRVGFVLRVPLRDPLAQELALPGPCEKDGVVLLQAEGEASCESVAEAEGEAVLQPVGGAALGDAAPLDALVAEGVGDAAAVPLLAPPWLAVGLPDALALAQLLPKAVGDSDARGEGEGCPEALRSGDAVSAKDGEADGVPAPGEAVCGSAVPVGEGRADTDGATLVEGWALAAGEALAPLLRVPLAVGVEGRLAVGVGEKDGEADGDAERSAGLGEGGPLSLGAAVRVAEATVLPLKEGGASLGDAVAPMEALAQGDPRAEGETAPVAVTAAVAAAEGVAGAVARALALPSPLRDAERLSSELALKLALLLAQPLALGLLHPVGEGEAHAEGGAVTEGEPVAALLREGDADAPAERVAPPLLLPPAPVVDAQLEGDALLDGDAEGEAQPEARGVAEVERVSPDPEARADALPQAVMELLREGEALLDAQREAEPL